MACIDTSDCVLYVDTVLLLQGSVQEQLDRLLDDSPVCAPARLRVQKKVNRLLMDEIEELRTQLESSPAQASFGQRQLRRSNSL